MMRRQPLDPNWTNSPTLISLNKREAATVRSMYWITAELIANGYPGSIEMLSQIEAIYHDCGGDLHEPLIEIEDGA